MSKPATFIQRTYAGVALYADGNAGSGAAPSFVHPSAWRTHTTYMHAALDATVPPGGGEIEYLVCSHVNGDDQNEVVYSDTDFDAAMERLLNSGAGQYLVAVRP